MYLQDGAGEAAGTILGMTHIGDGMAGDLAGVTAGEQAGAMAGAVAGEAQAGVLHLGTVDMASMAEEQLYIMDIMEDFTPEMKEQDIEVPDIVEALMQ